MTKTKITLRKDYTGFTFTFDDYDEAYNFMWTALYNAESQITATVEVVKDEEIEDKSEN